MAITLVHLVFLLISVVDISTGKILSLFYTREFTIFFIIKFGHIPTKLSLSRNFKYSNFMIVKLYSTICFKDMESKVIYDAVFMSPAFSRATNRHHFGVCVRDYCKSI